MVTAVGSYHYHYCFIYLDKCQHLLHELKSQFSFIKFANLFVRCFGIFARFADSFIHMWMI